jgi:hypothetical protein
MRCDSRVMSGRIKVSFVDLVEYLLEFDRVCRVSVRPFLVRKLVRCESSGAD